MRAAVLADPFLRPLEAELRAQRAEIEALRARLERLERSRRRLPDPDQDAAVLRAIAASVGSSVFATADLVRLAPHHPDLSRAIKGFSVRRLGLQLRRLSRAPAGCYRLHRLKRDGAGVVWILDVSRDHQHTDPSPAPGGAR